MAIFAKSALVAASLMAVRVSAQGDPEALTGTSYNEPTSSWQQWQPKPTYALDDLPDQYMGANRVPSLPNGGEPQSGFNRCAENAWNQQSQCQTAWINDAQDWCIWGPPNGGTIGETERVAVAYCTTDKHGTRLIPDGTLTSVHFLKTPNYVQVSGTGDFRSIGVPLDDAGGEMDPHGADDLGNPIGGVMYTTANPSTNGQPWMVREWTNFMSWNQYCLRACWGDQAAARCEHIYDVLGCRWNMPSASGYTENIWESCEGENAPLAGIFNGSTFRQGDPVTPDAHPPAASSNCQASASMGHGLYAVSNGIVVPPSSSSALPTLTTTTTTTESSSTTTSTATASSSSAPTGMTTAVSNGGGSSSTNNQNEATQNNASQGSNGAVSAPVAQTALLSTFAFGAFAVVYNML